MKSNERIQEKLVLGSVDITRSKSFDKMPKNFTKNNYVNFIKKNNLNNSPDGFKSFCETSNYR